MSVVLQTFWKASDGKHLKKDVNDGRVGKTELNKLKMLKSIE